MIGIIDIHCHIIYDVDDGPKTLEESKKMLEAAYAGGIRTIIATPHFRRGMFECAQSKIEENYEKVKAVGKTIGDGIEILLGCEYYAEFEMVEGLMTKKHLTMANSCYVLTEFSTMTDFAQVRAVVYNLISSGYKPILAHIERYKCLRNKEERIKELINLGAEMQINADSIIGKEGHKNKKCCKKLMKEDLISFVGTDGHDSEERAINISQCVGYVERKMGKEYAEKIFICNPQKITKTIC